MAEIIRLSVDKILVPELEAAMNRKDGYIMGARGQNPRTGYLDLSETAVKSSWRKDGWYYTQYLESPYTEEQYRKALYWREHATRVWDCNGLAEGIYEMYTGVCIDTKARFNYSEWCNPKGSNMADMPRVPGIAVFIHSSSKGYITHVGYLYKPVKEGEPKGDWWVIEARGVLYGVVKTKLSERGWNRWGAMTKYYDYEGALEDDDKDTGAVVNPFGARMLKKGCAGEDVRALQETLISLGFSCGKYGADGEFGKATLAAVQQYQAARGLEADGIVGDKTKEALMAEIVETGSEAQLAEEPAQPIEEPAQPVCKLTITGERAQLEAIQALYGGEISEVSE